MGQATAGLDREQLRQRFGPGGGLPPVFGLDKGKY